MNALDRFAGLDWWAVAGWTMLHYLWLGLVVGAVAGVLRFALRRASAQLRYAVALVSLAGLAVLPVGIGVGVGGRVSGVRESGGERVVDASAKTQAVVGAGRGEALVEGVGVEESAKPQAVGEAVEIVSAPKMVRGVAPAPVDAASTVVRPLADLEWRPFIERAAGWLPWVWIVGAPVTFLLLATGVVGAERLRRESQLVVDGPVVECLERLRASLSIGRRVAVAVCERVAAPVLVGVLRPLILLPPAALTGWSPDEIEMVLLHELAHVRRWDNLVNLVQRFVEAVLFFQPAVWLVSGWVRREREACCDAVVVGATQRPREYAELLVEMAARMFEAGEAGHDRPRLSIFTRGRGRPGSQGSLVSAMAAGPLRGRIRRILGIHDDPMLVSGKSLGVVMSGLLLAATLVVLNLPARGQAEESTTEGTESTEEKTEIRFDVGAARFDEGDKIEILKVRGTSSDFEPGGTYWIEGTYTLGSREKASLSAFVTATNSGDGKTSIDKEQTMTVVRGSGTFTLKLRMPYEGWPHVSFYPDGGGEGFGGVYFGTGDSVLTKWWDEKKLTTEGTEGKTDDAWLRDRNFVFPRDTGVARKAQRMLGLKLVPAAKNELSDVYDVGYRGALKELTVRLNAIKDKPTFLVAIDQESVEGFDTLDELLAKFHAEKKREVMASFVIGGASLQKLLEVTSVPGDEKTVRDTIRSSRPMTLTAPAPAMTPEAWAKVSGKQPTTETAADGTSAESKFPTLEEQKLADLIWKRLNGLELEPLTAEQQKKVQEFGYEGGLRNSTNNASGLQQGDILVGLHVWPTKSLQDVVNVLNRDDLNELNPLKYYVVREGQYGGASVVTGRIEVNLDRRPRAKASAAERYSEVPANPKAATNSPSWPTLDPQPAAGLPVRTIPNTVAQQGTAPVTKIASRVTPDGVVVWESVPPAAQDAWNAPPLSPTAADGSATPGPYTVRPVEPVLQPTVALAAPITYQPATEEEIEAVRRRGTIRIELYLDPKTEAGRDAVAMIPKYEAALPKLVKIEQRDVAQDPKLAEEAGIGKTLPVFKLFYRVANGEVGLQTSVGELSVENLKSAVARVARLELWRGMGAQGPLDRDRADQVDRSPWDSKANDDERVASASLLSGEVMAKLRERGPVTLLFFFARGSKPCQQMSATLDELVLAHPNLPLKIYSRDIQLDRESSVTYDIERVPALVFHNKGKVIRKNYGFVSSEELAKLVTDVANSLRAPESAATSQSTPSASAEQTKAAAIDRLIDTKVADDPNLQMLQQELMSLEYQLNSQAANTKSDDTRETKRLRALIVAKRAKIDEYRKQVREQLANANQQKAALRYDGKTFDQWRTEWQTELSTAKRIEAVKALAAFGRAGYGKEAAAVILDVAGEYDFTFMQNDNDANGKLKQAVVEVLSPESGRPSLAEFWLPDLVGRAKDDAGKWQPLLAYAVGQLRSDNPQVIRLLRTLAVEGPAEVQGSALGALVRSERISDRTGTLSEETRELLAAALTSDDLDQRRSALWLLVYDPNNPWALGWNHMNNPRLLYLPEILGPLLGGDEDLRQQARLQLQHVQSKDAPALLGQLLKVLKDESRAAEHVEAIRAIAAMGPAGVAATEELKKIVLESKDEDAVIATVLAVACINDKEVAAKLNQGGLMTRSITPSFVGAIQLDNERVNELNNKLSEIERFSPRLEKEAEVLYPESRPRPGGGMF